MIFLFFIFVQKEQNLFEHQLYIFRTWYATKIFVTPIEKFQRNINKIFKNVLPSHL